MPELERGSLSNYLLKLWPGNEFSQLFGTLTSILLKSGGKLLAHSRVPLLFFFGPLYLMFELYTALATGLG